MCTLYRIVFLCWCEQLSGMVYERQRHRTTTSHSHTSTYWSNIVPERLAEGVWCTKFQFLFWIFTSVSVGSSSRSCPSTNTCSHCEKEWQKPTRSNMWLSTFKNSVACVAGGIVVPEVLSWRQNRHAKRGARGKNWLVLTLLAAPPSKQYSTPMLIPPATQAKKSAVQLCSCLVRTQTSLSLWKCARKGRREGDNGRGFAYRLYPSHGPLRFITSQSCFALASTMIKTKRGWLRSVTEISPKSPSLFVNRSPVWYGFAGAKATRYSVNFAWEWNYYWLCYVVDSTYFHFR